MKSLFFYISIIIFTVTSCSQDSKDTDTAISEDLNTSANPNSSSSRAGETVTVTLPNIILKGTNVTFTGTASATIAQIQLDLDGYSLGGPITKSVTGSWTKIQSFTQAGANRQLTIKGLSSTGSVVISKTVSMSVYARTTPLTPALVLMYHEIASTPKYNDDVSTANFNQQMQWLKNNGYTSISTEDLYILPSLPSKSVVLTFDDGYVGNYVNARPILESLNLKADFFVHTDYVGTTSTTSWNKVSWNQLRTMDASPLFTVHSHTKNHLRLSAITAAELTSELVGSKQRLEQELGGSRNFLAYPFGDYNLNVINAAQAAGYTMAYAVANKGAFGKPLHYLFTRKGVGRDVTTIQKFKTRIGAI